MIDYIQRPVTKVRSRLLAQMITLLLCLGAIEAMAAGGKPATKIVNIADTRTLAPGISKWIADIYNTSYWQFGILTVVLMAGMGLILGYGCDRLMGLLGLDLGKIKHHE